jgi:hypothetical protein
MVSRLVATAVVVIALLGAGVAPCAGWQSTPKDRADCCEKGQCPGEISNGASHPGGHSGNLSQAQADQCCATSEQKNQQGSAQSVNAAFVLLQPVAVPVTLPLAVPLPDRAFPDVIPIHPPPTPLHVLFSVFLV